MTKYIFDYNAYQNYPYNEEIVIVTDDLRETTKELLQYYYEPRSDYGNPIKDLMRFIDDSKLKDILENYEYRVFDTETDVTKYIEELKQEAK